MASYLVSLHSLLEAQEKMGGLQKSQTLVAEYNRVWDDFKSELADDTRDHAEFSKTERKV